MLSEHQKSITVHFVCLDLASEDEQAKDHMLASPHVIKYLLHHSTILPEGLLVLRDHGRRCEHLQIMH